MPANKPQIRLKQNPTIPTLKAVEEDDGRAKQRIAMLRIRLGPLTRVPVLARSLNDQGVIADPRTGFVLTFVDGVSPLAAIIDAAGLPELEVLQLLVRARDQKLIELRD
jgi:hypothetical protein